MTTPNIALWLIVSGFLILAIAVLAVQVARLRRNLAAAVENAERYRLALDASQMGTFDVDLATQETRWSRYHELLFGFREGEFDGTQQAFRSRLHPEDRDRVIHMLANARQTGEPYEIETRVVWPDSSIHWVLGRGRTLFDNRGQPVRVVGTVVETTERHLAEQELSLERSRAQEAARAKRTFLRNISHEIRTPLTAVIGFSEILLKMPLPLESVPFAERIFKNGERLLEIVDSVLDSSRLETAKVVLNFTDLALPAFLRETLALFLQQARAKGLDLELILDALAPSEIRSDPTRLRQILVNVIGNAIKFTRHGRVIVTVASVPAYNAHSATVLIAIEDTGIGMNEAAQERIFAQFAQVDDSTTRPFGGAGLGLFLARQLARALGGDLDLGWSEPGKGSRFVLRLGSDVESFEAMPGALEVHGCEPAIPYFN